MTVNPRLRLLFDRQEGRCFYCDCDTYLVEAEMRRAASQRFGIPEGVIWSKKLLHWRRATIEHLVPKAMGGGHYALANMAMACVACNQSRDCRTQVHDHRKAMRALAARGQHPNHPGLELRATILLAAAPAPQPHPARRPLSIEEAA